MTGKRVPASKLPDLNTVEGFIAATRAMKVEKEKYPRNMAPGDNYVIVSSEGRVFCPGCGGRKVVAELSTLGGPNLVYYQSEAEFVEHWSKNQRYQIECRQCDTRFAAMIFDGPGGLEHVIIPNREGGYATPKTPEPVAYYLNQASRAEMTGAYSAAVAMFRAALEQLFYEQGFKDGMLRKKIETAFGAGDKRAVWADRFDKEFVEAIKKCGDTSIHPNDGDIKAQAGFDRRLIGILHAVFIRLLREVYELPDQEAGELEMLRTALKSDSDREAT